MIVPTGELEGRQDVQLCAMKSPLIVPTGELEGRQDRAMFSCPLFWLRQSSGSCGCSAGWSKVCSAMDRFEKFLTTVIACIMLGWLLGIGMKLAGIR